LKFLSLAARLLVNVEALNMVESIGNVTRHRRATIIITHNGEYRKIEVPAISGETLAHAYQEALVLVAKQIFPRKPPICPWCERGEFFKSMDDAHTMPEVKQTVGKLKGKEQVRVFEEAVIKNCLVEDIGGFLRAERPPVKRTSLFQIGYMVPTFDAINATSLESQFHVRHAPSEAVRAEKQERAAQMIYYIETGSALYGVTFNLDIGGIGRTSMIEVKDVLDNEEKKLRIKTALGALVVLLSSGLFGAKRTRFLPILDICSVVAAVSTPVPFTVIPPATKDFIAQTAEKSMKFNEIMSKVNISEEIKVYAYSKEVKELPENITKTKTVEDLLEKVIDTVLSKGGK